MSKHTPGPWEFEDIGEDGDNLRINHWERMEANKVAIAIIPVGYSEPFESEQRANAAFIVKAVNAHNELLEALEDCIGWLDEVRPQTDQVEASRDKARAAVAKAKGEQQ